MEANDIIRKIDYYRNAQRITIKELAERTGISYPYLTEVFKGKSNISAERLTLIVDALGLDIIIVPK